MAICRYLKNIKDFIRNDLTLEPVIFGYIFTWFVVEGSQMTTNLLITKICRIEMKYSDDFCQNMTSKANVTDHVAESEVQRRVNDFEVILNFVIKNSYSLKLH